MVPQSSPVDPSFPFWHLETIHCTLQLFCQYSGGKDLIMWITPRITSNLPSLIKHQEKWKTLLRSQKSLDMFEHISLMTLDSLLKCIFGIQDCRVQLEGWEIWTRYTWSLLTCAPGAFTQWLPSFCSKKNEYIRCVYALTDVSHMRFRYLPFLSDLIFNLSPSGFEFHKCCKIVHDYSQRIIYQRREEKKREKELGIKSNRKYMDFLDILIDAEVCSTICWCCV